MNERQTTLEQIQVSYQQEESNLHMIQAKIQELERIIQEEEEKKKAYQHQLTSIENVTSFFLFLRIEKLAFKRYNSIQEDSDRREKRNMEKEERRITTADS